MRWRRPDEVRPETLQPGAGAAKNDGRSGLEEAKMSAEAVARSVISIRMRE